MIDRPRDDEDENVARLMELIVGPGGGVTLPSAAFLRQVREAVSYSYQGGQLDDQPESVQRYCDGDLGLLNTLDIAVLLLEEREQAGADASLLETVARWLDAYDPPERDSHWEDDQPEGWQDREALRNANREDAQELLRIIVPALAHAITERLGDQLLPQFRDIVRTLRTGVLR